MFILVFHTRGNLLYVKSIFVSHNAARAHVCESLYLILCGADSHINPTKLNEMKFTLHFV